MAYFSGDDLTKHNNVYILSVLENIKNKKPIKTKVGNKVIIYDKNLKEIHKFMKTSPHESKVLKLFKEGKNFLPIFTTKKEEFKWSEIDKSPYSGGTGRNDAKETREQELASLYVIECAVKNKPMPSYEDLVEIYKNLSNKPEWMFTFQAQYFRIKTDLKKNVKNTNFKEFNRDGSFMDWISNLVKHKFKIAKKDTWNPADVWLLKDKHHEQSTIVKELKAAVTLESFNAKMKTMYYNGEVVGISLKKTSKTAYYELVNLALHHKEDYTFKVLKITVPLKTKDGDFLVKSSILSLNDDIEASVRTNQSSNKDSIIYEFKKRNSQAQFGKVPVQMLQELNNTTNKTEVVKWQIIPKTQKDFNSKYWAKVFNTLNRTSYVDVVGMKNDKEFTDFVYEMLEDKLSFNASSLLQSMVFFYNAIKSKNKKEVNSYFTEMCYLSQKKGKNFGPFGKLH